MTARSLVLYQLSQTFQNIIENELPQKWDQFAKPTTKPANYAGAKCVAQDCIIYSDNTCGSY